MKKIITQNKTLFQSAGIGRSSFRAISLLPAFFLLIFLLNSGCHPVDEPSGSSRPDQVPPPITEPSTDFAGQEDKRSVSPEMEEMIPIVEGQTAEKLLREMTAVYAGAKFYSDNAYIEALYEIKAEDQVRVVANRKPCSVTLEKPNRVRLAVGNGLLVSNGEKFLGRILTPAYKSEYIEFPAPLLLSSIKDLYPDSILADAMDMDVPTNVFWTPPQLILLLSKSPLKTLSPPGSEILLLSPAYLERKEPKSNSTARILCERVQILAEDGTRTLWINRERKTLERFEFPLEQLEVPRNIDRIIQLSIEFPELIISDETGKVPTDKNLFALTLPDSAYKVSSFLPLVTRVAGELISELQLRSLTSGFSDLTLNKTNQKIRVVCFWKGANAVIPGIKRSIPTFGKIAMAADKSAEIPLWPGPMANAFEDSKTVLAELDHCIELSSRDKQPLEFIAVNCDTLTENSDESVRRIFGGAAKRSWLYRFQNEDARKNIVDTIGVPSILLIDKNGMIQKYYRSSFSPVKLNRDIQQLLAGKNVFPEDEAFYRNKNTLFQTNLALAAEVDAWATAFDSVSDEVAVLRPQILPKSITLRKSWSIVELAHPGNPIVIPDSVDADSNGKKDEKKNPEKKQSDNPKPDSSAPASAPVPAPTPTSAPPPAPQNEPLLLVPCDGNTLAVIDSRGQIRRKIIPPAAAGEPITFVRSYVSSTTGKAWYVASALREARKVHRLGNNFEDLGSLDVGTTRRQSVADAILEDITGDDKPELILSLLGDTYSTTLPVHGLYAVGMKTSSILWKDENIHSPYHVESLRLPNEDGTFSTTLLAMNRPEGGLTGLIEDEAKSGRRINDFVLRDAGSVVWFTAQKMKEKESPLLTALVKQTNPERLYFTGLAGDATLLWKHALTQKEFGRQLEPISAGDINGDGVKEWIITFPDGTILFYAADGTPIDRMQYGEEVTGLCVVEWKKQRFLIITDVKSVTAWRIYNQ